MADEQQEGTEFERSWIPRWCWAVFHWCKFLVTFVEFQWNRTLQRGPDIMSRSKILEQNQAFWCPDTELLWTNWNMPSYISHHYFKLLWLPGDSFLFSIIICCVFSISYPRDLMVEPNIPAEHSITMQEWWKHMYWQRSTAFSYFYSLLSEETNANLFCSKEILEVQDLSAKCIISGWCYQVWY